MKNQTEYPKFISNQPCGKDMSFGKSQERVAKAMAEHIQKEEIKTKNKKNGKEEHSVPHIIGLEGDWGSGKSNLIRILKENFLKDTHYVFEYDAWGHQEDLQRRSFLETLTDELVKEEILTGKTSVELKNGDIKSVSWKDKLKYLLARKFETETLSYPKISYGIIIAFFTAIFLPITNYIANVSGTQSYWKILIVAIPIILSFVITIIIWVLKSVKNKKMASLDFLFAVFQDKITRNLEFKTISENEPSVTEFKNWMNDVSEALKKENQHNLIIVFDNMDRLPANKVKELWSSIHTFFAEVSYANIWVIITFDRNYLANAFGKSEITKSDVEAKKLTSHFINKSFPVIYRVASPVISDLKLDFRDYFDEAFGKDDISKTEKGTILRIFGIIKPNSTVRDIIAFINELVSQKLAWKKEISLLHIAVFTLTKDKIINEGNSIAANILSNNYYADILKLIDDEQKLQESISALAYNIDRDSARQVPMTQYLGILFSDGNSTNNISSYSSHRCFMEVLLDVIQDVDITLNGRTIKNMHELDTTELEDNENKLEEIWNYLTSHEVKQTIDSLKFKEEHRILVIRGSEENRNSILEYLCKEYQTFKEINGAEYYEVISQLRDYITEDKKLNFDIQSHLEETPVIPEVFIDYVEKAKVEYLIFKLICDNSKLNRYLIRQLPDNMEQTRFFDYLSDSTYDFTQFYEKLKGQIPKSTNENFYWLNYAYKALSPSKPLDVLLNQDQVATLQTTIKDKTIDGYFDISAMALVTDK